MLNLKVYETQGLLGIFAILSSSKHPFSNSILFDNCSAVHLVNDRSLLVPGTFTKASPGDIVECSTSLVVIAGRGERVLTSILNGRNLRLIDVAICKGFHINIVSAVRLRALGV